MPDLREEIVAILDEAKDLTLATVRPDGAPQATTVSYANDGMTIFFVCGPQSQKADNLAHDDRVSLTIDLPYGDWGQIRGLSLFGHAHRLTDAKDLDHVAQRFLAKFPEAAEAITGAAEQVTAFEITPELVSVLDYRQGFGHTDLVRVTDAHGPGRVEHLAATQPAA